MTDDEAIRQRGYLKVVADSRHRTTLRDYVSELVEQVENLLLRQRVGVVVLDAGEFGGEPVVHLLRATIRRCCRTSLSARTC